VSSVADRSELRRQLRAQRAQLDARTRLSAAEALVKTLEQLPEFLVDTRIAGYWAVAGEMPLHAAYASLRSREQQYFLPLVTAADDLQFGAYHAGADVQANRYGIPEPVAPADALLGPADLDLVLVPLLAFDRRGNRLGSGAGFYDRSFAFLRTTLRPARPVLVGIGYHFQEVGEIAPAAWDVKLDFIATDRELIACSVADPMTP
jgi:5-formyltetrahydrofolate cyclo-ligase